MNKKPIWAWRFESSSSDKTYETLQWSDGSLSCDCPGWTRRVAKDGSRTCKHTRSVALDHGSDAVSQGGLGDAKTKIILQKPQPKPAPAAFQPLKRKLSL